MNDLSVARFAPTGQEDPPILAGSRALAVAVLAQGMRDREVLLLAGPAGVGKSVVLNAALAALTGDAIRVIRLSNSSGSNWSQYDVAGRLLQGRPAPASAGQAVASIIAELTSASDGSQVIIAVDDADTMTDDAMEMLLVIASPVPDGVLSPQLVLAGRGAFWERRWRGEFQLSHAKRVTLDPLDGADAAAYVALHLRRAGGSVSDVSPGAMSAILRYSGGLPGRINDVLSAAVSIGIVRGGRVLSRPILKAAIASLAPAPDETRDEGLSDTPARTAGGEPLRPEPAKPTAPDFDSRAVVGAPILSAWSSTARHGDTPAPAACAIVVPAKEPQDLGVPREPQDLGVPREPHDLGLPAASKVSPPARGDAAERRPFAPPAERTSASAPEAEMAAPPAVSPATRSRQAAVREGGEAPVPDADPLEVTPPAVSPAGRSPQGKPPSLVAVINEDWRSSHEPNWMPFLRGSHGKAVAALTRGIRDHETLLFLTGPARVGKSIVLNAALAGLTDGPFRVIRLSNPGTPSWSEADLLRQMLGGRATAVTENWPAQAAIADLWETSSDEARVVVGVDDAQTLTDEAFELLLLTVLPPRRRGLPLQLVLSGRGEFWERQWHGRLQSIKSLAERITLRPLFGKDASDYIAFRLRGREGPIDDLVSLEAFAGIMRYSTGLPGRLDRILSVLIASRPGQGGQVLTGDMVKAAVDLLEDQFSLPDPGLSVGAAGLRAGSLTPENLRGATARIMPSGNAKPAAAFARTASETRTGTGLLVQRRSRVASAVPWLSVGRDASGPGSEPRISARREPEGPGDARPPFFGPRRQSDRSALVLTDRAAIAANAAASLSRQSPASADLEISFAPSATAAVARPDLAIPAGASGWRWAGAATATAIVVSLSLVALFPGQRARIEDTMNWTWLNALRDPVPAPPDPMSVGRPVLGHDSATGSPPASDKAMNAMMVGPWPEVSDVDRETSMDAGRSTESSSAAMAEGLAEGSSTAPNTTGMTAASGTTRAGSTIAAGETISWSKKSPASTGTIPAQAEVDIVRGPSSAAQTPDPRQGMTEGTSFPATVVVMAEASVATPSVIAVPDIGPASHDPKAPAAASSARRSPDGLPSVSTPGPELAIAGAGSTSQAVDRDALSDGGKAVTGPIQATPIVASADSPFPVAPAGPATVVIASSAISVLGRDRPMEGSSGAVGPSIAAVVPARPRSGASLTSEAVASLLRRGEAMLNQGDVLSARLLFERAAAAGSGEGAIGAGKTYDPGFLATIDAPGLKSDVARAVAWYRTASATHGDREADARLKALTAQTSQ